MYRLNVPLFLAIAMLSPTAVYASGHWDRDDTCDPEGVPTALAVPSTEEVTFVALGVGVQIYDCAVSSTAVGGFGWVFRAPEATLYDVDSCEDDDEDDDHGHGHDDWGHRGHDDGDDDDDDCDHGDDDDDVVGSHYVGPTWESGGGTVVGAAVANVPSSDPTAVPWLLLNAVSHTGAGPFSEVTHIQRLYTVGGKAPTVGCDGTTVGAEARIAYEATYYFYEPE